MNMGRRGPPKTPTVILNARGSWRGKTRAGEPHAGVMSPIRPKWLQGDAKAAWEQLIPMLKAIGVVGRVDVFALTRYCKLWARWRDCEARIDKYGATTTFKDPETGEIRIREMPWVS